MPLGRAQQSNANESNEECSASGISEPGEADNMGTDSIEKDHAIKPRESQPRGWLWQHRCSTCSHRAEEESLKL